MRCMHETQRHEENSFITLTFSRLLNRSLVKKHHQDFMKRLRRKFTGREISFYYCGEYGETCRLCDLPQKRCSCERFVPGPGRPHHHAILFGIDFPDKVFFTRKNGVTLHTSAILERIWGHGFCTVGAVTFESAAYVARYCTKKISGDPANAHYTVCDPATGEITRLLPEYTTMSLKRPIGRTWFDEFHKDVFPSDQVVHRGRAMRPPKYYDRVYELMNPTELELIKEARRASANAQRSNNTPTRLAIRETVKKAQIQTLKRELQE